MGIVDFYVEFYVGTEVTNRQKFILPVMMAILQCSDLCQQLYHENSPVKAIFYYDGNQLEYKNPKYIEFEKGK